jgi:hypothetical protein
MGSRRARAKEWASAIDMANGPRAVSMAIAAAGLWQAIAAGIWLGGSGNWSDSAKWSAATVPNDPSIRVKIDNGNAAVSSVALNQNATVGDVTLDAGDRLSMPATRRSSTPGRRSCSRERRRRCCAAP